MGHVIDERLNKHVRPTADLFKPSLTEQNPWPKPYR